MKTVYGSLLGALVMLGCAAPSADDGSRELRAFDLRKPAYQYVESEMYMDLPTVQRQLFIHREACDVEVVFRKDPMQVYFASIFYGPVGTTSLREQVMLDLTEYATGKLAIKGYAYYAANKNLARALVGVLNDPTVCPEGISPNLNPNPYVNMAPSSSSADAKKE